MKSMLVIFAVSLIPLADAAWLSGTVVDTECLGSLKIVETIGKGRNALVFKAQEAGSETGSLYAIKASDCSEQLDREAQVLQALMAEEGFPKFFCSGPGFIVMELMEGFKSLDKLKADGELLPLPIEDITIQLVDRLEAVHRAGFVHVDVHKRNIMVAPADGRVVLLDFGLAVPISEHKKSEYVNLFLSSVYEQMRQPLHPIDDIERLMFVLLHYSFGPLPWVSFVSMHEAIEEEQAPTKEVTSVLKALEERIFEHKLAFVSGVDQGYFTSKHVPTAFTEILAYIAAMRPVRALQSFSVDYAYLRSLLREGKEPQLPVRSLTIAKSEAKLAPSLLPIDPERK